MKIKMRGLLAVAAIMLTAGCGGGEQPRSTQAAVADRQGAEAAARLVAVDHGDTLALQRAILDARARADSFAIAGDTVATAAFDAAFENYLKEHDAALHAAIFNSK